MWSGECCSNVRWVRGAPRPEGAMSKLNIGIAVIVLATVLSAAGYAAATGGGGGQGGGGHGGGGHGGGHHGGGHGGAHFGGGGHRGGQFGSRGNFGGGGRHAVHNMRSRSVRNALNSRALSRTLRNTAALRNPNIRARVVAGAAMAGWYYGRTGSGWWQHSNGGYGWVGPLFWPFAYFDIYDYAIWGNGFGAPFWGYGYDDIYAGMFTPYAYDDLAGYLPPRVAAPGPPNAAPDRLAQMCGDDSRDIAGLPIDLIQQANEPTETQRCALDELAHASVKPARTIQAAYPTGLSLTAPTPLGSMQPRIEAMSAAVATRQPALD